MRTFEVVTLAGTRTFDNAVRGLYKTFMTAPSTSNQVRILQVQSLRDRMRHGSRLVVRSRPVARPKAAGRGQWLTWRNSPLVYSMTALSSKNPTGTLLSVKEMQFKVVCQTGRWSLNLSMWSCVGNAAWMVHGFLVSMGFWLCLIVSQEMLSGCFISACFLSHNVLLVQNPCEILRMFHCFHLMFGQSF